MSRILLIMSAVTYAGPACCYGRPPLGRLPDTACHVQKVYGLLGEQRTPRIEERARERSRNNDIRWIAPDTVVTGDHKETRLNILVDASGKIIDARCG
ncbi:MAG: I78 family peptidase inhibitor [Sphingomonas sp.]